MSEKCLDYNNVHNNLFNTTQLLWNKVPITHPYTWKDININKKLIRPWSLFLIRLFVKALSAPFGKKVWHRIEKNLFYYWMHPSYAVTITSYWNTLFDKYGQRSINSWTADQFVKRNGFSGVTNVLNKVRSLHKYK